MHQETMTSVFNNLKHDAEDRSNTSGRNKQRQKNTYMTKRDENHPVSDNHFS